MPMLNISPVFWRRAAAQSMKVSRMECVLIHLPRLVQFFLTLCLLPKVGHAEEAFPNLVEAKYSVYAGDINSDGCEDYLVKEQDLVVLIDVDEIQLTILTPPVFRPFVLQSGANCVHALVQDLSAGMVSNAIWREASYEISVGDVLGSGGGGLLLAPATSSETPTFNVILNPVDARYSLLQSLNSSTFQIGIQGSKASLENTNIDGRSDLVVRRGIQVIGTYAAAPDGTFSTVSESNNIGAAYAVWNSFKAQLQSNNAEAALSLISQSFQMEAREQMTASDTDLVSFANMITDFEVVEVFGDYVKAALILTEGGRSHMHLVLIGIDVDGSWKIFDF